MTAFDVPANIRQHLVLIGGALVDLYPEGGDEFDFLMLSSGDAARQEMIDFWSHVLALPLSPGELDASWPRDSFDFLRSPEEGLRLWVETMVARLREGVTPGVTLKPLGSRRRP